MISLSTGLTCVLLIYLWVNDELKVDKFNERDKQLFQVMRNVRIGDKIETDDGTSGPLAHALLSELPEVENTTSVVPAGFFYKGILSIENSSIRANPQFVDKNYFDVFSCNFIQGDKRLFVGDKNSVLISSETASKLFQSTDNIIGKSIEFKNEYFDGLYTIAGIFKDLPTNASAQFDIVFNYDLFLERRPEMREWYNGGVNTFLVLKEGVAADQFNTKIANFLKSKLKDSNDKLFIQRYSDRYLYGHYENGIPVGGRITYVKLFSIIALFILLLACVNFMNLFTAKVSRRIKDVGIKKTMGADRRTLIFQYMCESLLMTFIAVVFAVAFVTLLLPEFNVITGKQLSLDLSFKSVLVIVTITVITGVISGSYPAFYLSGFKPALMLKGLIRSSTIEIWFRRGLVIFQFSISAILIVSVGVIYEQIELIQTKDLGYNRENIIYFPIEGNLVKNHEAFLSQVRDELGVANASYMCGDLIGGASARSGGLSWEGKPSSGDGVKFNYIEVDFGLIELLEIQVKEGRAFSRDFMSDSAAIIFNEAAIDAMRIRNPIGKMVDFYGRREIIGVVKNFHFKNLYTNVEPLFFMIDKYSEGNIQVKINPGTERITIDRIQRLYKTFNPGFPFDYKFLDDDYLAQYSSEQRVAELSKYFAGLAIIISCLGLFGLTAFTVERKVKEIGIRKILGSSELGIVFLLSDDFTKMVFTSLIIALPISYLILESWLEGFAVKVNLEFWYFGGTALLTLFLAWVTVGMQTVRAARINPIKNLRTE